MQQTTRLDYAWGLSRACMGTGLPVCSGEVEHMAPSGREFLRAKLEGTTPGNILYQQVEAMLLWLVGGLPALPGFWLRYLLAKVLFARLGGFCWIQPGVTLVNANRLRVGAHFGCNTGTYINALGGIEIGDYVLIGSNVTISAGMHPIRDRLPPVFARPSVPKAIRIEDDVWIGAGAVILPGITIKRGSVIGANAVVTRDTEEYSINAGVPARKIGSR